MRWTYIGWLSDTVSARSARERETHKRKEINMVRRRDVFSTLPFIEIFFFFFWGRCSCAYSAAATQQRSQPTATIDENINIHEVALLHFVVRAMRRPKHDGLHVYMVSWLVNPKKKNCIKNLVKAKKKSLFKLEFRKKEKKIIPIKFMHKRRITTSSV